MITKQKTKDHTRAFKQVAIMVTSFLGDGGLRRYVVFFVRGPGLTG